MSIAIYKLHTAGINVNQKASLIKLVNYNSKQNSKKTTVTFKTQGQFLSKQIVYFHKQTNIKICHSKLLINQDVQFHTEFKENNCHFYVT